MFWRTTMPSPPLDQSTCWKMRGMILLSLGRPLLKQRHHVERAPAEVYLTRGVGVLHGHRVIDQHDLDLEVLAVGRLPRFACLEALVGPDDRPPAGPDVDGELDLAVGAELLVL